MTDPRTTTDTRTDEAVRLSEQRYRSLVLAMADIVWTTDARGQVTESQPGWRAYTGQAREEIQGAGWLAALHPDSREEAALAWARAVALDLPYETEWRLRRRDGEYRCFSIHAAPVRAANGAVREWIGCSIDITDRKHQDQELARLHAQVGAALALLERQRREMQILKNLSETLQACNSRDEAYPFIALAATELFPAASGALATPTAGAQDVLETATEWGGDLGMKADFAMEDCWALRRGGMHEPGAGTVCHHFQTEPIQSAAGGSYACVPLAARGEALGLFSLRLPETQHLDDQRRSALAAFGNAVALGLWTLQLRETLQKHAVHDRLTGLAGSEFSDAVLAREIRHAERYRGSLSVALLDLDGFGQLQEASGPRAADELLHEVGMLLRSTLGPLDLAARYDTQQLLLLLIGDELEDQQTSASMTRLRRICLDIQQKTYTYQGVELPRVTVSAGLAEWPLHGARPEELLRSAKQALRAAKLAGPGCIEACPESRMPPPGDARPRGRDQIATGSARV